MPTPPIALDRAAGQPLYRQLERQLRAAIDEQRLRPGVTLPGIRSLAADLRVARNTVVTAYEELVAEGYLVPAAGIGMRVAADPPRVRSLPRLSARDVPASVQSFGPRWAFDLMPRPLRADVLPATVWDRLVRATARDATGRDSERRVAPGELLDPGLAAVLGGSLAEARGVPSTDFVAVPTSGFRAAYAVAIHSVPRPLRACVVEGPGDAAPAAVLRLAGAPVVAAPVDSTGIDSRALPFDASLVAVSPAWQAALGGTLPVPRRHASLEWARGADAMVLEDDRAGFLWHSGLPPASIASLDRDARTMSIGELPLAASGSAPGFGYLLVPRRLVSSVGQALDTLGQAPSPLDQRTLARFIGDGHLDRLVRRLRVVLMQRHEALLSAVTLELGSFLSVRPAAAGTHVVATITDEAWTARSFAARCAAEGVAITGMEPFVLGQGPVRPEHVQRVVLSFAADDPSRIRHAVAAIARAVRSSQRVHLPGARGRRGSPAHAVRVVAGAPG